MSATVKTLDCRGLSCPQPVLKTKEALEQGADLLEVIVDKEATKNNVSRFAASQGIDEQKFRDAMDSFLVQSKVRRADDLARRAGIRGVPSVVVAGRYLVTGQQAGSYDRMIEIIDYLVRQEAARGKSGG